MEFAQEQSGDIVVVKLAGRLDSGSAHAAEENFNTLLAGSVPRLVIDMSGLDYVSSAGLRVLLVMAKKVQQAQGKVALFGLTPNVREVFTVTGFDTIFSIQNDSTAAAAAVR